MREIESRAETRCLSTASRPARMIRWIGWHPKWNRSLPNVP